MSELRNEGEIMENDLDMAKGEQEISNTQRPLTIRESLVIHRNRLAKQLEALDTAIKALDEFPAFEKVHDAISKSGINYMLR